MLKQKNLTVASVLVMIIIILGALYFWNTSNKQEVSIDTPVNIVLDFYMPWLNAVQSEETNPYQEELDKNPILSKDLRTKLKTAEKSTEEIDPVLCQTTVPSRVAARVVFQNEETAEILVTARPSDFSSQQAIAVLNAHDGGWYIHDIRCSPGEFAPDREFTFEREGNLLKSVPEPFNPENWHLVYEENGVPGHAVPLFFDAESTCQTQKGDESVCNPDSFVETSKVYIKGQMTEAGVELKHLEFKK